MATKRQSAEFREREAQATAAKRKCADIRDKEAQAMATKRQSAEFKNKKHMQRSSIGSSRAPLSCKPLKPSLWLLKKGQITSVSQYSNRLMYRKTVIEFKAIKYSKAPDDFTAAVLRGSSGFARHVTRHSLKQGKLPAQAKANNLDLEDVPPGLSELNHWRCGLFHFKILFRRLWKTTPSMKPQMLNRLQQPC